MDGVGAGLPGGADHALDREVALARGRRADRHRLVGRPDVGRAGIGLRVHGDRPDAELPAGADDPSAISPRLATSTASNKDQPRRRERRASARRAPALDRATSASRIRQGPPASAPIEPARPACRPDELRLEDVSGRRSARGDQLEPRKDARQRHSTKPAASTSGAGREVLASSRAPPTRSAWARPRCSASGPSPAPLGHADAPGHPARGVQPRAAQRSQPPRCARPDRPGSRARASARARRRHVAPLVGEAALEDPPGGRLVDRVGRARWASYTATRCGFRTR